MASTSMSKTFNILILGETGVGKSTFVNALMNYLTYETMDEAETAGDILTVIPSNFTMTDENFVERDISCGKDANESTQVGASATQSPRSYKIALSDLTIRVIDTPGIGDTRGVDKDDSNLDKLLTMIGELDELHAICILLKPSNARLTVLFEYCVHQLLLRLEKSASRNIVFIFTNARSSFYRPGDTLKPLKKILGEIKGKPPHVDIPFGKENVFCMDNEAFRFLVAKKYGIGFSEQEIKDFSHSWTTSRDACKRLIEYVTQMTPHKVRDTVSVNEARRSIALLSEPLARITENINKNITMLERHQIDLNDSEQSEEELKEKLYVPVNRLKITEVDEGRTVCTHESCTDTHMVLGVKNIHYRTVCHSPCTVIDFLKHIIGKSSLQFCSIMERGTCKFCSHHYSLHIHINCITEPYEDKIVDKGIQKNIEHKQNLNEELKRVISDIEVRKAKYAKEKEIIQQSMAKLVHFLQNSAIISHSDKYKCYIELLIKREENCGCPNVKLIESYNNLIKRHEELKLIHDKNQEEALLNSETATVVSASDVQSIIEELYKLELTGNDTREFYEKLQIINKKQLTTYEKTYSLNPMKKIWKMLRNIKVPYT